MRVATAKRWLPILVLLASVVFAPFLSLASPSYDLFLKSDYGRARFWLNTQTGEFRWEDEPHKLLIEAKGTLAFPNLGPVIFTFSGEVPGYDWVSICLKLYGTTATGYLAAFPEGEPVRKVVSNMYDRDTRDDLPPQEKRAKKEAPKRRAPPRVEGLNPHPAEVPSAASPKVP
ncbi:MAG: hypothetical protein ACP5VF_01175 [Acidobacteriota bacterium]